VVGEVEVAGGVVLVGAVGAVVAVVSPPVDAVSPPDAVWVSVPEPVVEADVPPAVPVLADPVLVCWCTVPAEPTADGAVVAVPAGSCEVTPPSVVACVGATVRGVVDGAAWRAPDAVCAVVVPGAAAVPSPVAAPSLPS
jgi:hypothetical protein